MKRAPETCSALMTVHGGPKGHSNVLSRDAFGLKTTVRMMRRSSTMTGHDDPAAPFPCVLPASWCETNVEGD
jgi:hypothetical protein